MHFQGLFKNMVFRSVALVTKKLWAISDFFFTDRTFLPPCTLPYKFTTIFFNKKSFVKVQNNLNKNLERSLHITVQGELVD